MSVLDIYELKRHGSGTIDGVFIATSRTKTAFTAERNEFKVATVITAIHGTAKRGIATVDHFINIFYDRVTRMEDI